MAASIDLQGGGTGGPGDLDVLVKALDRFTAALQGVAKSSGIDGAAPGEPAAAGGGLPALGGLFSRFVPPQLAEFANAIGGAGERLAQFAQGLQLSINQGSKLPAYTGELVSIMGTFGSRLASLGTTLIRYLGPAGIAAGIFLLAKKLPVLGDLMEIGVQAVLYPIRTLGGIFSASLVPLRQFQERAGVVASSLENLGKAQNAYSLAIGNSSKMVSSVVKGGMDRVTAVLSNPLEAIPQLVSELRPFVEAFNPAVLQEYDQAMRSVMAVIGEALVPVIRVASALLREFAGYLRPIMRQLEPVITEVARAVGGFLKEILPLLPEFINSLLPILRNYGEMLKDNIAASIAYQKGEFSMLDKIRWKLSEWTGGLISKPKFAMPAAGGLPPGVQKENIGAYGAAQAPTFKGTAELGRDLMQAAFVARPGELQDNTAQETADNTARTADLLEQLVDINKGAETYDARVQAGGIIGGAQAAVGRATAEVYNFGVGTTNLLTGNWANWDEGMVDI